MVLMILQGVILIGDQDLNIGLNYSMSYVNVKTYTEA